MTTYTTSGIPVNAASTEKHIVRGVYVDGSVDSLLSYIKCEQTLSLEQTFNASVKATTIWVETGGLFNPRVLAGDKMSASARSFVMETAGILSGRLQNRRVGWPDWRVLLCPSETEVLANPNWTKDELEELRTLQLTPTPVLIQRWVSEHGIGDLVQTLGVYVSPSF